MLTNKLKTRAVLWAITGTTWIGISESWQKTILMMHAKKKQRKKPRKPSIHFFEYLPNRWRRDAAGGYGKKLSDKRNRQLWSILDRRMMFHILKQFQFLTIFQAIVRQSDFLFFFCEWLEKWSGRILKNCGVYQFTKPLLQLPVTPKVFVRIGCVS